jgi:hypothetical protein
VSNNAADDELADGAYWISEEDRTAAEAELWSP